MNESFALTLAALLLATAGAAAHGTLAAAVVASAGRAWWPTSERADLTPTR